MKEIYKNIEGFEGRYQVSNYGNVLSLNYQNTGKARLLTPIKHHLGYLIVHLGESKIRMIHTLVAKAFIPNPNNRRFVNHIDGDKTNNVVTNLEWVTSKENINHAIKTGLRNPHKNGAKFGEENKNRKPILQYSKTGEFIKRWECMSDAGRYYKMNPCMIVNNASGRTKSAHGFIWKYPE